MFTSSLEMSPLWIQARDAAAVGDGHHVLGGHGELSVLADGPQHGVGDQVAQVGLLGAVAGLLGAVELHVGSGKNLAVLGVDVADDLVGGSLHGGVLLGVGGQVDEAVALDALGGVVNDDGAHIGKAVPVDWTMLLSLLAVITVWEWPSMNRSMPLTFCITL